MEKEHYNFKKLVAYKNEHGLNNNDVFLSNSNKSKSLSDPFGMGTKMQYVWR